MAAFVINANVTNAQKGIPTLTITTAGNSGAAHGNAAKDYLTITDHRGVNRNYVITDTQNGGVANGTVLAHGSDIGSENIDQAGSTANLIGGIAVATNLSSATQRDVLVALKACIESTAGHGGDVEGFEDTLTVSAVPSTPSPDDQISMTITLPAGYYRNEIDVTETDALAGIDVANTVAKGNNNAPYEALAFKLDDSDTIAGALQDRMGTGSNIATGEYEVSFIPGIREFLKKVK